MLAKDFKSTYNVLEQEIEIEPVTTPQEITDCELDQELTIIETINLPVDLNNMIDDTFIILEDAIFEDILKHEPKEM